MFERAMIAPLLAGRKWRHRQAQRGHGGHDAPTT